MSTVPVINIPAGAEGIDFAWWRPGDQVRPWAFVVRYICKLPNGKAVTKNEIDFYHSLGVSVLLVWEQAADDWTKGKLRGVEHGMLAAAFAEHLGYPHGLPILFAYDTNVAPGDSRAFDYGTACANQVEAAGYTFGVYADLDVMRMFRFRSELNWLAGATSWSDPTRPYQPETMPDYDLVHVRQVISGSTPSYDRNITLRRFPGWLPHEPADLPPPVEVEPPVIPPIPTTPTTPLPEDDDMNRYVADSASKGSALVTLTVDDGGHPRYTMVGFDDPLTARAFRDALGGKAYSDPDYLELAAGASR